MARGVLGNDPFKRGAAKRESEPPHDAPSVEDAAPGEVAPAAKKQTTAAKNAKSTPKKAHAPARKSPKKKTKASEIAFTASEAPTREVKSEPEPTGADEILPPERVVEAPVMDEAPAPAEPETPIAEEAATRDVAQDSGSRVASEAERPSPAPRQVEAGPSLRDRAVSALVRGREVVSQAATSSALTGFLETATGVMRAVQTGLGTAGSTDLDDYGKDERLARQLGPLSSILYEKYWRVKVEGAHLVPRGASIIVANHSGAIPYDGPVLHEVLRRERPDLHESRWLVEDQIFYAPFLGTLMNRLGAVRACPENAIRLLEEDRPVVVFPEGIHGLSKPWSERYKLMRFGRGGFVKLAIRLRVPIIPVAVVGAEESMPLVGRVPGKLFGLPYVPITSPVPLPARWFVRFGEPMTVDEYPTESQSDQVLVNRINERTRETIQGMLEAILKARESIFA